ncbi:DMT family transporter [Pelagibaculum spongiae]|uniref:EamA family transporter n=1 Tax=Pelagibaculum spongiae TaxID=2080658 RepID=A0A2V1GRN7_9GAMM|nr:DMT family transporter [Pelagibaculum spongiae]PVZ66423.1 EamA family transporter [Pelagibaculum spongiae]
MFNGFLYLATVLIWGTTWYAIKLQLGVVDIEVSMLYRFALACIVMWLIMGRRLQPINGKDHLFCFAQGATLFSFNFLCFYTATQTITSGLLAVVFSFATVMNALNGWWVFGQKPSIRVLLGSAIGLTGITALFAPEFSGEMKPELLQGLGLATLGTWLFSMGNMISVRHQKKGLRPPTTNSWGLLYGVLILLLLTGLGDAQYNFDMSWQYSASLGYLAVFGTVIAFTTYLLLVGRIGADKAAYSTVLFPVVALLMSSWLEGYQWSMMAFVGLALVIAGNLVIFAKIPSRLKFLKRNLPAT